MTTESDPAPSPPKRSPSRRIAGGVGWILWIAILGAAIWLVGAIVATIVADEASSEWLRAAIAGGVALLAVVVLPLMLDRWITKAYRRLKPKAPSTWRSTVVVWNVAVLCIAVGVLPRASRQALVDHGAWWTLGDGQGSVAALGRWVGVRIPRSGPTEALQVAPASASPSSSSTVATLASGSSAPVHPAASQAPATPAIAAAGSPEAIFQAHADAVVVIETQQSLGNGPAAEVKKRLGLRHEYGMGSGFVVAADGLIVTNYHVAGSADALRIRLRDGRTFTEVKRLAMTEARDLALLRIEAKDLATVTLAERGRNIPIGSRAIAIGSPLGLEFSVTDGIISAAREINGTKMLQMQTTIAPGSSGGPLFAPSGVVIGVNTATHAAGLNLAVNSLHVHELLELERKEVKLASYQGAVEVISMDIRGREMLPSVQANLRQAAQILAHAVDGCVDPIDKDLVVELVVSGNGASVTSSDLTETQNECLKPLLILSGHILATLLADDAETLAPGSPFVLETVMARGRGAEADPKRGMLTMRHRAPEAD